MGHTHTIIVFSHLRWDFVYQRPQHLLSRLATKCRVIFIEEPIFDESGTHYWEKKNPESNVLVCRPHTDIPSPGYSDSQIPLLKTLVRELIHQENITDYVLWFYTPMALPLAENLRPQAVIYDCMDELSAFLNAPPELLEREAALLKLADLVFTGGPSLYRAKKDRHPDVHCFPSSVDAPHFGKARGSSSEAPDQAGLPHPRLGFFGVIDERLDLNLLDQLAASHPEWQILMVGPVVKIDPATLPRHKNLHYFGQRGYAELPGFLAGWDVCLLPFARNQSTKFISPTKTLEYMAAEKPIVSTPITDVAEPYADIVYLGSTPEAFIAGCEKALAASRSDRVSRLAKMRDVLARTSWDQTANDMEELVLKSISKSANLPDGVFAPTHTTTASGSGEESVRWAPSTIVVGAGPTGLSAAYHLGEDALLLEQNDSVGGWCRSVEASGFTFDYAGHIMFSNEPYVHQLYKMLLGDNVHWQDREAWIYSKDVYTRYPFQGSLYGLPANVIKECITGAIEARFGSLRAKKGDSANAASNTVHVNGTWGGTNGHANGSDKANRHFNGIGLKANGSNGHCKVEPVNDCCADGILESTAALAQPAPAERISGEPCNFEEFIYKIWGAGIAKHFAIPYNKKLWAVPLSEMETSWLGGRVPMPDLEELIEGALSPLSKPMGPNARFGYPLRGGFQALMEGFLPHLKGQLRYNSRVEKVSPSRHELTLDDGTEMKYEHLISTMPLPVLIRSMSDEAPREIREAARSLRHVSVRCVHIGVGRENITDKHWIYYPEDTVFHRIFVQGNASPHCNPPGGFGFTCEITYSPHKPLPCDGDALIERCIDDARRVGFIGQDDPIWEAMQCDLPYAYVVYDHGRTKSVARIREWLAEQDIILAGRYGEWEYYNSDHAFIAGQKAADTVIELKQERMNVGDLLSNSWELSSSQV